MKGTLAILAAVLCVATQAALAQQKKEKDAPMPPPPPGVLEGQFPPANVSAAPAQPAQQGPKQGQPQAQDDMVLTRNRTGSWLWVTFYRGGAFYTAGCVKPQQERVWTLGSRPEAYRIRGELTREEGCVQPPTCDTSIERAPAMNSLDFVGEAPGCRWQAQAPRSLKNMPWSYSYHAFYSAPANGTSIWVTIYEWGTFRDTIVQTFCLEPGRRRRYSNTERVLFRAELTIYPKCQGKVACDTKKQETRNRDWVGNTTEKGPIYWDLKTNSSGCWWARGTLPWNEAYQRDN